MRRAVVWLVGLTACRVTDSASVADSDVSRDTDSAPVGAVAADPKCESESRRGATTYWVGDLAGSPFLTGSDNLVLVANGAWKNASPPGSDCVVVYEVDHASLDTPEWCAECEHAVYLSGVERQDLLSDCPSDVVLAQRETFYPTYEADVAEGGEATFYDHGVLFGSGTFDAAGVRFTSVASCFWF